MKTEIKEEYEEKLKSLYLEIMLSSNLITDNLFEIYKKSKKLERFMEDNNIKDGGDFIMRLEAHIIVLSGFMGDLISFLESNIDKNKIEKNGKDKF